MCVNHRIMIIFALYLRMSAGIWWCEFRDKVTAKVADGGGLYHGKSVS